MNPQRPTSLTVVAWLLMASAAVSLVSFMASHGNATAEDIMRQSLLPLAVQYAIGYTGLAVQVACAAAILTAQPWGRWVYVGWGALGLLVGFLTSPIKMALIPGLVLFAVVAFVLFRPAANAYFKPA